MNTRQWLSKRRARLERVPRLEDALVGPAPMRYAVYRLKYVFLRAAVRTVFRLLELALFVSAFSFAVLGPVLWIRSVTLVGEGLWWGALEGLRREVRQHGTSGTSPLATIRAWLALAGALGLLVVALSVAWVVWGPSRFVGFSAIDTFVLGCAVRWGLDLWVRAYHSGVYGIRRVYRPLWSLLAVDVADVVVFIAAYWWLGSWGFGISLALVGVVRALLSFAFTRRVYRQLKLTVGSPRWWLRSARRHRWPVRHSVNSALGNVVTQLDALLVLGLLLTPGDEEGGLLLAALFHGVAPLQAAAFSWSRLFYFDFKRLESWGSPLLLQRFESFLGRVAWWVPWPLGLMTLALLATLWKGPFWLLSLELLALAAVRARLSLLHVRAYSLSDHRFLAKLFLGLLALLSVTPLLGRLPPQASLGAVVLLAGLGLGLLGKSTLVMAPRSTKSVPGLSVWMRRLSEEEGPVRVGLVRVDRRLVSVGRCLRALSPALTGAVTTRLGKDAFVWFAASTADSQAVDVAQLVTLGAGTVRDVWFAPAAVSGAQALEQGVNSATWTRHVTRFLSRSADEASDLASLSKSLHAVVPGARCVALPGSTVGTDIAGQPAREIRQLILESARGRAGFRRFVTGDVAVLAPGGTPLALIVVPTNTSSSTTWRADAAELLRRAEISMTWKALALRVSTPDSSGET
jgi:hypothetical protein